MKAKIEFMNEDGIILETIWFDQRTVDELINRITGTYKTGIEDLNKFTVITEMSIHNRFETHRLTGWDEW